MDVCYHKTRTPSLFINCHSYNQQHVFNVIIIIIIITCLIITERERERDIPTYNIIIVTTIIIIIIIIIISLGRQLRARPPARRAPRLGRAYNIIQYDILCVLCVYTVICVYIPVIVIGIVLVIVGPQSRLPNSRPTSHIYIYIYIYMYTCIIQQQQQHQQQHGQSQLLRTLCNQRCDAYNKQLYSNTNVVGKHNLSYSTWEITQLVVVKHKCCSYQELKDVVFEDGVLDNNCCVTLLYIVCSNIYVKSIIIKDLILKHHILELPKLNTFLTGGSAGEACASGPRSPSSSPPRATYYHCYYYQYHRYYFC